MILDLQNYLSNPASGDSVIGNGTDQVSGNVLDQNIQNGLFTGPGGAEIAPFVFAKMHSAAVGGTSVQFVIQDSADNVTYADAILGDVVLVASAVANKVMMARRLNRSHRRYIRGVWRTVGNVTGGIGIAVLALDVDNIDLAMRGATQTVSVPSGAADESVAQGILEQ